jgi:hypothetical protein
LYVYVVQWIQFIKCYNKETRKKNQLNVFQLKHTTSIVISKESHKLSQESVLQFQQDLGCHVETRQMNQQYKVTESCTLLLIKETNANLWHLYFTVIKNRRLAS